MFRPTWAFATVLVAVTLILPNPASALECYCVKFLRDNLGVQIKGDAWTITPNKDTTFMSAGDVLLTYEGQGHASLITGFEGETYRDGMEVPAFIRVVEKWPSERCLVRTRLIPWGDPKIRGVFHPTTLSTASPF